jgi:acetaldehyde dehydrogenase (acetylating)
MEKLSPTLAFYVVKDWREGCTKCIEILNFGGLGHTLSVHTKDEGVVREFGLRKPAFRICVNTPAALGAVGYTTNLFPSMTLGCGAAGGNITSDNISPLHLINLKRVAYGVRDVATPLQRAAAVSSVGTHRANIEQIVDQWLGGRAASSSRHTLAPPPISATAVTAAPPAAPPLSSYAQLEPAKPKTEKSESKPVGFVCEEDVRAAVVAKSKIVVGKKTIITPSARELAEANDIFIVAD